jgi:RNA polymerase sigma-70 factor (sigma-E family)
MTDDTFEHFAAARWPVLVRAAWLLTGDWHTAEDLAQTTLARTWRHWRRVVAADDPDRYVRRILVNEVRRSRAWRRSADPTVDGLPVAVPGPEDQTVARDALARALAQLPAGQRLAVTLRYYLDLSELDTAAILGCSVGNVKSQTSRGLVRLREVYAPALAAGKREP